MAQKQDQNSRLQTVIEIYRGLDDSDRNLLLERLIEISSDSQDRHLKRVLAYLDRRVDFISHLPLELTELILNHLDADSLLNCTQVCSNWEKVISALDDVWLHSCHRLGVCTGEFMARRRQSMGATLVTSSSNCDASQLETAKDFFIRMRTLMANITYESAWDEIKVSRDKIRSLHLWGDTLFTASDDTISILNLKESNISPKSITTIWGVTNVRGDDNILVASFRTGILTTWNRISLEKLQDFGQHFAAITSFDFNHEMDLLVSGSKDGTIKLFSLQTGVHHRTLQRHSDWVSKILLHRSENEELLFTMGPLALLMWKFGSTESTSQNRWQDLSCLTQIYFNDESLYYTPGFHFDGQYAFYMQQATSQRKLCKFDVRASQLVEIFELNIKVSKLLSVGCRYACFLSLVKTIPHVIVLDLQTMYPVASWNIPKPSRVLNAEIDGISLGENVWLRDGFNGFNNVGMILAVAHENIQGMVSLLQWKVDD